MGDAKQPGDVVPSQSSVTPAASGPANPASPSDAGATPSRPLLVPVLVAIIIVLALALTLVMVVGTQKKGPPTRGHGQPLPYGSYHNRLFGDATAKVEVLAVLPLQVGCHGPNIEYLQKVAQVCGQQVRVRFVDLRREEAAKTLADLKCERCATILINGKSSAIGSGGKEVKFTGPLNEGYTLKDLRGAVQAAVRQAYGDGGLSLPEPPDVKVEP